MCRSQEFINSPSFSFSLGYFAEGVARRQMGADGGCPFFEQNEWDFGGGGDKKNRPVGRFFREVAITT